MFGLKSVTGCGGQCSVAGRAVPSDCNEYYTTRRECGIEPETFQKEVLPKPEGLSC